MKDISRKITIEVKEGLEGDAGAGVEQSFVIATKTYDILEKAGLDGLNGIKVTVWKSDISAGDPGTRTYHRSFDMFYSYPISERKELKLRVGWSSANVLSLEGEEVSMFVFGTDEKGQANKLRVSLPLQPETMIEFEELFAQGLVLALTFCLRMANEAISSQLAPLLAQTASLENMKRDTGLTVLWKDTIRYFK